MELITNKDLKKELLSQVTNSDEIYFSVAWASMAHEVSHLLLDNKSKIKSAVIGTHFYQTDPEFIKSFNLVENVGFIKQTSGVFHPKVYLFKHSDNWQIIVGSANLTSSAMSKNDEISIKLTVSSDLAIVNQYLTILSQYSVKASSFESNELEAYTKLFKANQKKVKSLGGDFGDSKKRKLDLDSMIITRDWLEHVELVKDDPHGIEERLELLTFIQKGFRKHKNFSSMTEGLRRTVAGLPTDHHAHWGWFGSMKGAGRFHNRVKVNNQNLSTALDQIPLNGEVDQEDYFNFIEEFKKAFPDGGDGVAIASRLLAMKRPDTFVCIDGKNKRNLCIDFGIAQSSINYDSYWFEVIGRIQASAWWQVETPINKKELEIFNGRVALLDCIFYED